MRINEREESRILRAKFANVEGAFPITVAFLYKYPFTPQFGKLYKKIEIFSASTDFVLNTTENTTAVMSKLYYFSSLLWSAEKLKINGNAAN